ncbi:hypothetical protein [Verrucomicrobium sp. BvORR034]|uniref:hypothetical protein n=1 Tax=Verrucomicrobium sp. BvORR034 TaxID=1396418 RepID=UPI000678712B|nr:hypothetical protein [Verrucomicrobium sp. BvORR034]
MEAAVVEVTPGVPSLELARTVPWVQWAELVQEMAMPPGERQIRGLRRARGAERGAKRQVLGRELEPSAGQAEHPKSPRGSATPAAVLEVG